MSWSELIFESNEPLVRYLEQALEGGEEIVLGIHQLVERSGCPDTVVRRTMAALEARSVAEPAEFYRCRFCHTDAIDPDDPGCEVVGCAGANAGDDWAEPVTSWRIRGTRARDLNWIFAIHGMNTLGPWQEEFGWQFALRSRRAVPCHVYKYGLVVSPAFLPFLRRRYVRLLARDLKALSGRIGGPPDVIAHSLGTWLLSHALRADPDLQVRRVILTGCILRPDFPWRELHERCQVEEILCHCAGSDLWVKLAHFAIHDAGPAGRVGFQGGGPVVYHFEPNWGHSTFFRPGNLTRQIEQKWVPFLTAAEPNLGAVTNFEPGGAWRPRRLRWVSLPFSMGLCILVSPLLVLYHGLLGFWGEWTGRSLGPE